MARRTGKGLVLSTLLAAVHARGGAVVLLVPAACLAAGGSVAPADPAFLRFLDRPAAARASAWRRRP